MTEKNKKGGGRESEKEGGSEGEAVARRPALLSGVLLTQQGLAFGDVAGCVAALRPPEAPRTSREDGEGR